MHANVGPESKSDRLARIRHRSGEAAVNRKCLAIDVGRFVAQQERDTSPCPFRAVSDEDLSAADYDVEGEPLVVESALDDAAGERAGHAKGGSETRIVVRAVATP